MSDNIDHLNGRVLDAYTELIRAHLNSDKPYRFKTIARLCKQANELAKTVATRVGDVVDDWNQGAHGVGALHHINGQEMHQLDGVREVIHQVGAMIEGARRESDVTQLDRLGRVRDVLIDMHRPTTVIDDKIDEILVAMDQPEGDNDAVVPTELLRGHQTDASGQRQLSDRNDSTHGERKTSAEAIPKERSEEGLDRHEVQPGSGNGTHHRPWAAGPGAGLAGPGTQTES